jgi:hypothetical protein
LSLEDEHACAALSARYAYYCDRDRSKVVDLFTDDAVLELVGRKMRGREEIRKGMFQRPGVITLHICGQPVIDIEDRDNAHGWTHLLSMGYEGEARAFPLPMPVARTGGIYFDRFRRVDGRWLFSERRLDRVFTGPRS